MNRFILILILRIGLVLGAGIVAIGLISLAFAPEALRLHVILLIFMGAVFTSLSGLAIWLMNR